MDPCGSNPSCSRVNSTCDCPSSPPHPARKWRCEPSSPSPTHPPAPTAVPSLSPAGTGLHQPAFHPRPYQVQGREQSLVLTEGKIQPEERYILSRLHPRPRPARGQEDSRQAATCVSSPPSVPSVMTMCQLTILPLSLLQALHCLQDIDHQVPKHSMQDSQDLGPVQYVPLGPFVALGLQSPVPQTYRTSPTLLEKPAFLVSPLSTCQNPMQLRVLPLKASPQCSQQ